MQDIDKLNKRWQHFELFLLLPITAVCITWCVYVNLRLISTQIVVKLFFSKYHNSGANTISNENLEEKLSNVYEYTINLTLISKCADCKSYICRIFIAKNSYYVKSMT